FSRVHDLLHHRLIRKIYGEEVLLACEFDPLLRERSAGNQQNPRYRDQRNSAHKLSSRSSQIRTSYLARVCQWYIRRASHIEYFCKEKTACPLFNQVKSPKIVFGPAGLTENHAAERADRKRIGILVGGDGDAATVRMFEMAMTSNSADIHEPTASSARTNSRV